MIKTPKKKIKSVDDAVQFQQQLLSERQGSRIRVLICMTGCRALGAHDVAAKFREGLKKLSFESKVTVVGIDNSVYPEDPKVGTENLELYHTHDFLLSNDIPIIEGLINLDRIGKTRFFLIGAVVPIVGLEAFPIRVIALV